jgi:ABC-2 type transport system ATP-binding protein
MSAWVEATHLAKSFQGVHAVKDISLKLAPGEVLGFLGPNGAGKTTTMRMITGYLPSDGGRVQVRGYDVREDPLIVRQLIGYLPEGAPLYGDMTPSQLLDFIASARGLTGQVKVNRLDYVVHALHLQTVFNRPIERLSKGFKRRVGLASAILHNPDILILDEPTDGLDPNQKHEVRSLIREMAEEKAIIISTHILEEVEAVCTRAVIIDQGEVVLDGTPHALIAQSPWHHAVAVTIRYHNPQKVREDIEALECVSHCDKVEMVSKRLHAVVVPKAQQSIAQDVAMLAHSKRWEVETLRPMAGHLEEVFRKVTQSRRH